ncbi:hypothetical protein [Gordonia sp. (in: high G+C Gram-positive bacteria)]|uniref:hypothetical protein n=1 Tax=Gordonia sp. (in: high G+C Gram-positive bacteria) TaxID=84139 RepID=UPI003C73C300
MREGWGAYLGRFRRQYHHDLREALTSMPWQDVTLLLDDLAETWTRTDENLASLVDIQNWWLEAEYVKWTTDPAEAKSASRRAGGKVPPLPALRAVAHRPPKAHAAAVERYAARVPVDKPVGQMDARAFGALFGL